MSPSFEPVQDPRPDGAAWPQMSWPVPPDERLVGEVVELEPADPARDGPQLFDSLDHPEVWAHTGARPRDAGEYVEQLARAIEAGRVPWVVRLRRASGDILAGAAVGSTSYLDVSVEDARLEIGSTAYAPTLWGTAVNPETKLLLLQHAFEVLRVGRVQLKTDVRNVRSQDAIARLGAKYEGTLRRYQRRSDGSVRDTVMFAVTAEDWPTVQANLQSRLAR